MNPKIVLYTILQCTWGLPQTLIGGMIYLLRNKSSREHFRGAIVTISKSPRDMSLGLSLGLFIFIQRPVNVKDYKATDRFLLRHEYGHTIQSLILGPLYLPVIGLPSFLWANLPCFEHYRRQHHISYYAFYTERWANHLADKYLPDDQPIMYC